MTDILSPFAADRPPSFLLLQGGTDETFSVISAWGGASTVRTLRGRKMRSVEALFDEVSAALQFPSYFGENWAALDECLSDMEWPPADTGIAVVILDAVEVLADDDPAELGALVRAFAHAADTYSRPIESGEWWDRPAIPFRVVLQAAPADAAGLRARWTEAGAVIDAGA